MRTARVAEEHDLLHHREAFNLLHDLVKIAGAHIEARRTFPFPHVYRLCYKSGSGRKVDQEWVIGFVQLKWLAIKRLDPQYDKVDATPAAGAALERHSP